MANLFSNEEVVSIISTTGTLSNTPDGDFFLFIRNGIIQVAGGVDYTLSGTTITVISPQTGSDVFEAWYTYSGTGIVFSSSETITIASTTGTLAHSPNNLFFFLTRDGIIQQNGVDYTQTGTSVTVVIPQTGTNVFEAWYSYSGIGLTFSNEEGINIVGTAGSTSQIPDNNFFVLVRNGIVQQSGVDYTLSGTSITVVTAQTGFDTFEAWYTYVPVVIVIAAFIGSSVFTLRTNRNWQITKY
jgi:hypothetical protein